MNVEKFVILGLMDDGPVGKKKTTNQEERTNIDLTNTALNLKSQFPLGEHVMLISIPLKNKNPWNISLIET